MSDEFECLTMLVTEGPLTLAVESIVDGRKLSDGEVVGVLLRLIHAIRKKQEHDKLAASEAK